MRKTLTLNLKILFLCSVIFAQSQEIQQKNYSESIPYSPRKFSNEQPESQNDKKKKKTAPEKPTRGINNLQRETINESGLINIPISVFDRNGQPIKDLQKTDFKIFINDAEQEIASFSTEEQPLNLILILDISPSLAYEFEDIKIFASSIAASLKPQDKIQIITFSEKVTVLNELTGDRRIIDKAVKKIKFGDGTSIYEAISSIFKNQVSKLEGRKTIVLLTDAVDTTSRKSTYENSLTEAEKSDAVIFPFYIDTFKSISKPSNTGRKSLPRTSAIDQILNSILSGQSQTAGSAKADYIRGKQYLLDLAALSGGRAMEAKNLPEFKKENFENILNSVKPRYFVTIDQRKIVNQPRGGQIKVRVNRPNLIVKSRASFIAEVS
jgi:VWFA-related protein